MFPYRLAAMELTLALWFVEFVVFALVVIAWRSRCVQERIKARLVPILKIREAGVVPFRVRFKELSHPDWIDIEKVERLSAELRDQEFVEQGSYEVAPLGILCRIHYHPQLDVAGTVIEGSLPLDVCVSLSSRYEDGTEFCYSSAKLAGVLDQPPYKTLVEVHEDDVALLVEEFLAERPTKPVVPCPAGQFAAWGEESHRREMDWRIDRGGLTEDEIRRVVEAQGGEATPELVATIRERYRVAIEEFRREPPSDDAIPDGPAEALGQSVTRTPTQGTASMLRFTIREWALICIIVGLALGWGMDHWSTVMIEKRRAAQMQEMMLKLSEQILSNRPAEALNGKPAPE